MGLASIRPTIGRGGTRMDARPIPTGDYSGEQEDTLKNPGERSTGSDRMHVMLGRFVSSGRREKRKILPTQHGLQGSKNGKVLLAKRLSQREQLGKAGCSKLRTKPSRDFVLELYCLDRPFRAIVVWGHIRVAHERKDPVFVLD